MKSKQRVSEAQGWLLVAEVGVLTATVVAAATVAGIHVRRLVGLTQGATDTVTDTVSGVADRLT